MQWEETGRNEQKVKKWRSSKLSEDKCMTTDNPFIKIFHAVEKYMHHLGKGKKCEGMGNKSVVCKAAMLCLAALQELLHLN